MRSAVSIATCDGMRDCVVVEMPDRGACDHRVPYAERAGPGIDLAVVVKSYTARPGVRFEPPCGSSAARFFDASVPNDDPFAPDLTPLWALVHNTTFVHDEDLGCVLLDPPPRDDLLAVFEISDRGGDEVVFGREPLEAPSSSPLFARADYVGTWTPTGASLRVSFDQLYVFPACCSFPASFTDSDARVWQLATTETTCGVPDAAEYLHSGGRPSTTIVLNSTHERWRYLVSPGVHPQCTDARLADDFVVDVFYKYADPPRALAETAPALVGPVVPYSGAAIVVPVVFGSFFLALAVYAFAHRANEIRKMRRRKNQS